MTKQPGRIKPPTIEPKLGEIHLKILESLKTYQWTETAVVYRFAYSLDRSESFVRRALDDLIDDGLVVKVEEGKVKGKPRYIFKLSPYTTK